MQNSPDHIILFTNVLKRLKEVPNRVATVDVDEYGNLNTIVLNGFSKSGTATVMLEHGQVFVRTRYNQTDVFDLSYMTDDQIFEAIASVAWGWYINFNGREPFGEPASEWVQNWLDNGLIELIQKPTYVIRK